RIIFCVHSPRVHCGPTRTHLCITRSLCGAPLSEGFLEALHVFGGRSHRDGLCNAHLSAIVILDSMSRTIAAKVCLKKSTATVLNASAVAVIGGSNRGGYSLIARSPRSPVRTRMVSISS